MARTYWIDDPQAGQCGRHFKLVESIGFIFVEIPKRAFKLFELRWREVGHVTGYDLQIASALVSREAGTNSLNLIIQECNLLRNVLDGQLKFEPQVLTSEHCIIVFVDIGIVAGALRFGNPLQGI